MMSKLDKLAKRLGVPKSPNPKRGLKLQLQALAIPKPQFELSLLIVLENLILSETRNLVSMIR